jgi:predicted NAD/FAD-binding protein
MPVLGHRKPSVAVVGSGKSGFVLQEFQPTNITGLAGLTAAYLLSSSGARTGLTFDVHIFEKVGICLIRVPCALG